LDPIGRRGGSGDGGGEEVGVRGRGGCTGYASKASRRSIAASCVVVDRSLHPESKKKEVSGGRMPTT